MISAGDCVAMLLAGGEGRRLGILTRNMAKPAVPFGGKYRIVDFTMSNCKNSGIQRVGVLTQYKPQALNAHIGVGSPWGLDRGKGRVTILPPYACTEGIKWYKGTADAVYQNLCFIDYHNSRNVLVVSGDHIYKMDYSKMLQYHLDKQADVTIAAIEVPWAEAGRFGILDTDSDGKVVEFEEKPQKPRNNLASMGIYIFDREIMKEYLEMDQQNKLSSHDFGKNVLPQMHQAGCRVFAYLFRGYWKDVGTLESYWEASMDLLNGQTGLDFHDPNWPIYTVAAEQPPEEPLPASGLINCSLVNETCEIRGRVEHSVLFPGVQVGRNSVVRESIIMEEAIIGEDVFLERAIVKAKATVQNKNFPVGPDEEVMFVQRSSTSTKFCPA